MDEGEPPGAVTDPAASGYRDASRLRHLFSELAGAFGDFVTIVPLILAAAVVCGLPLAPILLFFGIWYIATGLIHRLPIPVEPMKAVATLFQILLRETQRGEILQYPEHEVRNHQPREYYPQDLGT